MPTSSVSIRARTNLLSRRLPEAILSWTRALDAAGAGAYPERGRDPVRSRRIEGRGCTRDSAPTRARNSRSSSVRHAEPARDRQLCARLVADDQVIGVAGDGARDPRAEALERGGGVISRQPAQRAGQHERLAGEPPVPSSPSSTRPWRRRRRPAARARRGCSHRRRTSRPTPRWRVISAFDCVRRACTAAITRSSCARTLSG